ncbi:MAG: nucleotidyltransferase family protein [Candidatus Sedimenticola sp. (ex Thyasira tokunagai)]
MPLRMMTDLQPEEQLLFACLREEQTDQQAEEIVNQFRDEPLVWEVILNIAWSQGVAPLIYTNLKQCAGMGLQVPDEILDLLHRCRLASEKEYQRRQLLLKEALLTIHANGNEVMLLKGIAHDTVVHSDPVATQSADIDLMTKARREEFPKEQLKLIYRFNRQEPFEINFGQHHDLDISQTLSVDYDVIWSDAREIELFGSKFHVMCPEDMLIFACTNSGRKRFFHLKAIYAIVELLRFYPDMDWKRLATKVKQYQCHNQVYAALLATSMTTQHPLPENVRTLLGVGTLRARLIKHLVRRMSYSSLAERTLLLSGGAAVTFLTDKEKWNRSGLLPFATYDSRQLIKRTSTLIKQARNRQH